MYVRVYYLGITVICGYMRVVNFIKTEEGAKNKIAIDRRKKKKNVWNGRGLQECFFRETSPATLPVEVSIPATTPIRTDENSF